MEISVEEIYAFTGNFFWPFLRISALFVVAPFFGARTVPVRIRIVLAVLVTIIVQSTIPVLEAVDPLSLKGFLIILQQLSIGIVMGMILQIMFSALVMAGQVIATAMGLGFASSVDPQNGIQVTMLSQFYLMISTLLFLAIDGHLFLLKILAESFTSIPVSASLLNPEIFWSVSIFMTQIFTAAVLMAMPAMTGVLLVNLGFGVMMRAAPQLNIFAVGFPITILAGFLLMLLSLPVIINLLETFFSSGFDFVQGTFL